MFWSPLDGAPDVNNEVLKLNLNNVDSIKKLVNELLYVEYNNWSLSWRLRCKESLKYVICYATDEELIHYYRASCPKIKLPSMISVRDFYIYVWEFMFGEESYEANSIDDFEMISQYDIFN